VFGKTRTNGFFALKKIATQMFRMAPYSLKQLSMEDVFGGGVLSDVGSIRVAADHTAGVLGVLSLTHRGLSTTYFDEELAMPTMEGSNAYRGVADDAEGGSAIIAVTSLSAMSQQITVTCLREEGAPRRKTLDLAPNGTVLIPGAIVGASAFDANADGDNPRRARKGLGIAVTSNAMAGEFAVYGVVAHRQSDKPFFTSVNFSDPKTRQSSDSVYVGIPVGPSSLLAAGSYTPEISLTNFGAEGANIALESFSTANGKAQATTLASFVLAAGGTRTVPLVQMPPSAGLTNGLLVRAKAQTGDVLSKLVSRGGTALPVVEMLDKDEHESHNAGGHPWNISPGMRSTLLLFNGEPTPQQVNVRFGTRTEPWMKQYTLAPFETRAINIDRLFEEGEQDDSGHVLPVDVVSGEVGWQSARNPRHTTSPQIKSRSGRPIMPRTQQSKWRLRPTMLEALATLRIPLLPALRAFKTRTGLRDITERDHTLCPGSTTHGPTTIARTMCMACAPRQCCNRDTEMKKTPWLPFVVCILSLLVLAGWAPADRQAAPGAPRLYALAGAYCPFRLPGPG
jgi:hypothetical protein